MANKCKVNYIFVGGSSLQKNNFEKTIKSIKSFTKIPVITPTLYWFALVDDHGATWVILPWTKCVADAKHALYLIKQKYNVQWKVKIYVFTTDRLLVTL